MTHDELIGALEKATGPSFTLEQEIFRAVNPNATKLSIPNNYTASIDAALTLVPEGWGYTVCTQPPDHKPWASVVEWQPDDKGKMWTGNHMARSGEVKAATPALAICIAALKSHGGSHG